MTNQPIVSIIIPVWNGAAVLPEALRSLQAQTFGDFEALILDDGSSDDSVAIVREFSRHDPRFIPVSRAHSGLPVTRNFGIRQARGEFIAFLDHDDVWLPEKLQRQMELFQTHPRANFSFTNFFYWDGVRDLYAFYPSHRPLPEGNAARQLVFACVFGMSSIVVKRQFLFQTGLFREEVDYCEDWDLWLRMAEAGLQAIGVREPLMRYRRWPGNMSRHTLKMALGNLSVLQHNLQISRRPELAPFYRRSINIARARLELIHARQLLDSAPEKIPAALWRAWQLNPKDARWLLRIPLVAWPKFLGGKTLARGVHRKLIEKY